MALAILMGLALSQTRPPSLPADVSSRFHHIFNSVVADLAAGRFDDAQRDARAFPIDTVHVSWDDSAAPPGLKAGALRDLRLAENSWTATIPGLKFVSGAPADISFAFVKQLPPDSEGLPKAALYRFDSDGRLHATIGLRKGAPAETITQDDIYMAIGNAVGQYLGLAQSPIAGSPMHLVDYAATRAFKPMPIELISSQENLKVAKELRNDVANHVKLVPVAPSLQLSPSVVNLGNVAQGSTPDVVIRLKNVGTSRLDYQLVPDCGCFSYVRPGGVAPGSGVELVSHLSTTEYVGSVHKDLALFTNDPKMAAIDIPVNFRSVPAFRLYRPEGDNVIVPTTGETVRVLLTLPSGSKLHPAAVEFDGIPGTVSVQKWSGKAPDPLMGEANLPRSGYLFKIKIGAKLPPGRSPGTLQVQTDSLQFPVLKYTLYAQRGIVALPDSVFYGDMTGVVRASVLVSRPGKPFKITSVETGNSHLKATVQAMPDPGEFRVDVVYDGQAPIGDFRAVLRIHTDDPAQPTIEVPVTGTVL